MSWIDFKDIKSRLNFEQVLRHYGVELNINGDKHLGFCPLPTHQGKRNSPSFSVQLKKGIWHCFGCKACGNILDFAVRMEGLNPSEGRNLRDVALKLKKQFLETDGVKKPGKPNTRGNAKKGQQDFFPPERKEIQVNAPLDFELKDLDPEHPYLKGRGFTLETLEHFGVGFCERGYLKDRIAIPLHNEKGELIGYAGRTIDDTLISAEHPKYKLPAPRERNGVTLEFQKSLVLYNAHRIKESADALIVVEGFPSVWWLHQAGLPNVVAIMGSSCSERQAELIVEKTKPSGCIYIMPDHDHAGLRCSSSLLNLLAPHRMVRWITLKAACQPTSYEPADLVKMIPHARLEKPTQVPQKHSSIKARLNSKKISERDAIVELANSFPSLRSLELTADTWDAMALDASSGRLSSGERVAVQFVLNVWNGHQEWQSGTFDVVSALDVWDSKHREAFLSWASEPWWC